MLKKLSILVILAVGISIAVPDVPFFHGAVGVVDAHAQEKKRKTLFDILFKRRKKKPSTNRNVSRGNLRELPGVSAPRKTSRRTTQPSTTRRSPPPKPQVIAVKNESAPKILVVGDFMASGLASGLERLYSENPDIVIVNRASASSGIVRDDVVDWPQTIPEMIEELKPVAVVNLSGMNDRQSMRLSTGWGEKLSEAWLAEYNKRVDGIINAGRNANIPVVWVGIPPVKSGSMNSDYLVFNEIYRGKIEAVGASYVDVWDGFTDAEGRYVSAGPDINGQIVRLRGSNGISMTRAGMEKLAFFADKVLKRMGLVGAGDGAQFASLGTVNVGNAQPQVPEYDPVGTGKTIVISLGSPISDGGNELEGGESFLSGDQEDAKSVSYSLVEKGMNPVPREGRIDAAWGLPAPAEKEKSEGDKDGNKKASEEGDDKEELSSIGQSNLPKVTNIRPVPNAAGGGISVQN